VIPQDPREPVQELVRLRAKVNLLLAMNSQLRELIQERDKQLQEVFASTSWKMMMPLRRVGSWVKRSRTK
jgi:hypothetical protein